MYYNIYDKRTFITGSVNYQYYYHYQQFSSHCVYVKFHRGFRAYIYDIFYLKYDSRMMGR